MKQINKSGYFYNKYNYDSLNISRVKLYSDKSHPYRIFLNRFDNKSHLLDAGCGTGILSGIALNVSSCKVTGIDLSKNSIRKARKNIPTEFKVGDVCNLPFKDNSFEGVISNGVIHHTKEPIKAFDELSRVCKDKGYIYLSVYNKINKYFILYNTFGWFLRLCNPDGFFVNISYLLYQIKFILYGWILLGKLNTEISIFNYFADRYLTPIAHFYTKSKILRLAKKNNLELELYEKRNQGRMHIFIFKKENGRTN